ncbi:hypothetical protein J8L84_14400 [Alteromonas sp. MMG017]|nr:hypothetical protein [Alteromonas sp. MMG017]MBQ4830464.1 hypothetical protein [Alteromonas sp. MMG017]
MKFIFIVLIFIFIGGCTTGKLYYTDKSGKRNLGCDVAFTGLPSVDKFAVEYALSLCAKNFIAKGYAIDDENEYLIGVNTSIPQPPCDKKWDHSVAKAKFKQGLLSKKEYGYIVAHIDLGLAEINQCEDNNEIETLKLGCKYGR